ncbi:MAG: hypothetical protein ACOX6D_02705 [Thermoguttaceae bacterium]|jgi:hypothetical protein
MFVARVIDELIQALGCKNKRGLAKKIGRNPAVISHAVRENKLPDGLINHICVKFPHINPHYLATGKGDLILPERDPEEATKERIIEMILDSYALLSPDVQNILLESFRRILKEHS